MNPRKLLMLSAALGVLSSPAFAQNANVADSSGCGFGTSLWEGKRGVAPQVLAITTNNSTFNQWFGISSGTLGCNQDGVVRPPSKVEIVTASNLDALARDIARGRGEALDSLALAMAIAPDHQEMFRKTMQSSFKRIFPSTDVVADEVVISIRAVMSENSVLSNYVNA
jgi:hypothetical protein